jgi:NAD(P)-dependent dehydrogenase (short-subunit alcohol dehydrogenase family)
VVEDPRDGGLLRMLHVADATGIEAFELDALLEHDRAPSSTVRLHASVPYPHVDLVQPAAMLALACAQNGERRVHDVFGRDVGWLDEPLRVREYVEKHPEQVGVVLRGRGVVVFGESSEGCYRNTVELVNRAQAWLAPRLSDARAFGEVVSPPPSKLERGARAAALLARLRKRHVIVRFDDSPETLAFVSRSRLREHVARRGPDARVVFEPGLGLFTFGADASEARAVAEHFALEIAAIRGAESIDRFAGLVEREPHARRDGPAPPLAGRVAVVVSEGALGVAIRERLVADGTHVLPLSLDPSDEASVALAFERTVLAFGGVDVVVFDAGPDSATPLAETPLALWRRAHDAPFLVAREAFRRFQAQELGGSLVFVSDTHSELARRLALEGVPHAIRVNTGAPGDSAPEAIAFLASDRARGYTGNRLTGRPGSA